MNNLWICFFQGNQVFSFIAIYHRRDLPFTMIWNTRLDLLGKKSCFPHVSFHYGWSFFHLTPALSMRRGSWTDQCLIYSISKNVVPQTHQTSLWWSGSAVLEVDGWGDAVGKLALDSSIVHNKEMGLIGKELLHGIQKFDGQLGILILMFSCEVTGCWGG